MLNKKLVFAIIIFIIGGFLIYSYANPLDNRVLDDGYTDHSKDPTPSPSPSPSPSPTPDPNDGNDGQDLEPTPSPTPGATPRPTPRPTATPTPKPSPTPGPTPTPTPKPTPTPTPTPTPRPVVTRLTGNNGADITISGSTIIVKVPAATTSVTFTATSPSALSTGEQANVRLERWNDFWGEYRPVNITTSNNNGVISYNFTISGIQSFIDDPSDETNKYRFNWGYANTQIAYTILFQTK